MYIICRAAIHMKLVEQVLTVLTITSHEQLLTLNSEKRREEKKLEEI